MGACKYARFWRVFGPVLTRVWWVVGSFWGLTGKTKGLGELSGRVEEPGGMRGALALAVAPMVGTEGLGARSVEREIWLCGSGAADGVLEEGDYEIGSDACKADGAEAMTAEDWGGPSDQTAEE